MCIFITLIKCSFLYTESMDTVAGLAITTKVNDKVKADHVINTNDVKMYNLNVSNVENISNRKNDDSNKVSESYKNNFNK